jgi:WD40 repeat protein
MNNKNKLWNLIFSGILVGILSMLATPSFAQCSSDGDIDFICGPISPEDLVQIPDSSWVLVSSWEDDGYLTAANADNHQTTRLFPTNNPQAMHDAALYGQCAELLHDEFRPHGMTLRSSSNGNHTLYVVRHGAREAIEVFEVSSQGNTPSLIWVGCVVAPEGVNMNSIVALPEGGFAVSSPRTSDLWEWQPTTGWSRVPGSEDIGPNGLEITPDGKWYYVAGYAAQSVLRLSRGSTPVQKETVANVGFNIDNIHWSPDGHIFAAGHKAPSGSRIGECIRRINCEGITSHVAKVNTATGDWQEIFNYPSNENLRVGTVAIQVGEELWIGSVAGSTRIARIQAP